VVEVQSKKAEEGRKKMDAVLELLRNNYVVVEGKHDVEMLGKLGISAIPYERLMRNHIEFDKGKTIYLLMDDDNGGYDKEDKALAFLIERGYNVNTDLGRHLLKVLKITSVEQAYQPIMDILEKGSVRRK